tara:strand:+ start:1246 stop:1758 length:513 start_codon:yes stop_codon:yes gene_type:complete
MAIKLINEDSPYHLASGEHMGFSYCVTTASLPHRCGYIAIPPGHPWQKVEMKKWESHPSDLPFEVTFSAWDRGNSSLWCRLGRFLRLRKDYKWLGMDCGHMGDLSDITLINVVYEDPEDREMLLKYTLREYQSAANWKSRYPGDERPTVKTTSWVRDILKEACERAAKAA